MTHPRLPIPVAPEPSLVSFQRFEDEGVDVRHYGWILRKRAWLIGAFLATSFLVTLVYNVFATRMYTAETVLLIERNSPQILDIQQVIAENIGTDEQDFYNTQYEILRSRSLVAQVIFDEKLQTEGPLAPGAWFRWIFGEVEPPARPELVDPDLVDEYIESWLDVDPLRRSRLVRVRFRSPDRELSARVANAHARSYIRRGVELRTGANAEARLLLEGSLDEMKRRVRDSEAALNEYRRGRGIISLDDKENLVVDRLAGLNTRLTEAETERIAREAEVRLVRERAYDSIPAVVASQLIQDMKEELSRLQGEYAFLASKFKPDYSRLSQLRAQVAETQNRIDDETTKIVASIESSYMVAKANEETLREALDVQKEAAFVLKDASVEYASLLREADTNGKFYDSMLQRLNEMDVATELRASSVYVLDAARPPARPSSPKVLSNLLFALAFGLLGGLTLAFLVDWFDNKLRSAPDVDRYLGLGTLGLIPDFEFFNDSRLQVVGKLRQLASRVSGSNGHADPAQASGRLQLGHDPLALATTNSESTSVAAEAYRSLRTSILLSRAGEPPRTILITSPRTGEGKTATTLNTAIMFAQLGAPVLVIDADLRRPRCHEVLGVENRNGLTEVLTGQCSLTDAVVPTAAPFYFLPAGKTPPNPTELLGSERTREVLLALQKHYEYILIDGPPIMPVIDSIVLSTTTDGVLLVIDQQSTSRQAARESRARLDFARARILGVVLNRVDPSSLGELPYFGTY